MGQKFIDKLAEKLVPIAGKLAANRYLIAIRDAFMNVMPLIIAGSFFVLINALVLNPKTGMFAGKVDLSYYQPMVDFALGATMNILSLFIVFLIAYHLTGYYKGDKISSGILAISCFVILLPLSHNIKPVGAEEVAIINGVIPFSMTNSTGLFTAIFTAIVSTECYIRLCKVDKLKIKMPDQVPPASAKAFNSLFPIVIVMMGFVMLSFFFNIILGKSLNQLIAELLQMPLQAMARGFGGTLVNIVAPIFLWFFGIHGHATLAGIRDPILNTAIEQNIAAQAAGQVLPNIHTQGFQSAFTQFGGSGATLALIVAILLVSTRKDWREVAKLGVGPGIFMINEPIMFGLPIVLNPILFIPFILAPLVTTSIAYFATAAGLVGGSYVAIPWSTPVFVNAYLTTGGDWRAVVLSIGLFILSVIIYLPFVLAANKMKEIEEV